MNQYDYLFYSGILMLPTCIAQIIPRIKKKNTAPYSTFFFCICCNIGIGFLIYYFLTDNESNKSTSLIVSIVFLIVGYLPQIIPFSICCCPTSFEGNFLVYKEIFGKTENRQDFFDKFAKNRIFAPLITVYCEASHTEHHRTTRVDEKGRVQTQTHNSKVITYRNHQIFRYNSWQEEGNPIRISDGTVLIHAVFTASYRLDGEAQNALQWLRQYMYQDGRSHDIDVRVWTDFEVPGMTKNLCGTTIADERELPCSVSFLSSCFGRFIFILMSLIGYQSVLAAFWCSQGERLRLRLIKKISMNPQNNGYLGLRAGYLETDNEAVERTFRVDNLEEPLLPPSGQQPFVFDDSMANYNAYMNSPYYQNFVQNNYAANNSNYSWVGNNSDFVEVQPIPYVQDQPKQ